MLPDLPATSGHVPGTTPGTVFAGRTFDAVLFDMDGTLISSIPAVTRAWRRWAREHGVPGADSFEIPHGTPARAIVESLLPADRVEEGTARITALELEDTSGVEILPGSAAALAALGPRRAAIVTSCTGPLARARIRAAGIAPPATVVTADDVERGKPDPQAFLEGARRLGVDPARCLVAEDAPAGLAAGRAAGCATLAILGTHTADELDADACVRTLADVRFAVGPDGAIRVIDAPGGAGSPVSTP